MNPTNNIRRSKWTFETTNAAPVAGAALLAVVVLI